MSTTSYKCGLSMVSYRPNPAFPDEGRIPLGVLLEHELSRDGKLHKRWVVWAARREVSGQERLDSLAREVLKSPFEFIKSEILANIASSAAVVPFGALTLIARRHAWSINVSPPREVSLVKQLGLPRLATMTRAIQDFLSDHEGGRSPKLRWPEQRLTHEALPVVIPPAYQIDFAGSGRPLAA